MGTSKIAVDLNHRTFEIEVPDENVGDVLQQMSNLFAQNPALPNGVKAQPHSNEAGLSDDGEQAESETADNSAAADKIRRKKGSARGPVKIRSYQLVDLGLTQEQRLEMQSFFNEKGPQGQNDQVAVLAVKVKEFTGRQDLSVDDIHSAFKVVNRPTPRNLTAVLGNMKRDGKGGYAENKLIVNSFTEDYVAFHMNAQKTKKPAKDG